RVSPAEWAGAPAVPPLRAASFVDPNFGLFSIRGENDEPPPTDIQRGQAFVSRVVNAVRNGPYWKDSVILITYDENGGFYDHVAPPRAPRPDAIDPGQCQDLSNPPASLQPGGGAECSFNFLTATDTSVNDAIALCPEPGPAPTGPYPARCANFDQAGFRVPFIAVSPFSKPSYVSHTVGDHTSIAALIERIFLPAGAHLTARDAAADPLLDLFDFDGSPSLRTSIGTAGPPAADCTPCSCRLRVVDQLALNLGPYRLVASLGQGGQADVFLAVKRGLAGFSKLIVIKSIRPDLEQEQKIREALVVEARLAARLHHPNVVQTLEVGEHRGHVYLAMEFLDGQPLSRVARRLRDRFSLPQAAAILEEMLSGLHCAHELRDYDG